MSKDKQQWWQLSEAAISDDPVAQEERRMAYAQAFYNTAAGREVLFDLTRICYSRRSTEAAMLACIELLHRIKANCGIGPEQEMAAIEAEANA